MPAASRLSELGSGAKVTVRWEGCPRLLESELKPSGPDSGARKLNPTYGDETFAQKTCYVKISVLPKS